MTGTAQRATTVNTNAGHKSPVDRLTAGQRECLRLVAQLQSSKEIAQQLLISNYTVDQRVARACRTLGAATRAEAARILTQYEAERPISDTVTIASKRAERAAFPQFETEDLGDEPQIVRNARPVVAEEPQSSLPFPTAAGNRNNMSFLRRLAWAAVVAGLSIVVFGILLASLAAIRGLL